MEIDPEIVAKAVRDNPTSIAAAARQAGISRQSVYYQCENFDAPKKAFEDTQPIRDAARLERIRTMRERSLGTQRNAPASRINITLQDDTIDALKSELARRGYSKGVNWLIDEIVRDALGLEPPDVVLPIGVSDGK